MWSYVRERSGKGERPHSLPNEQPMKENVEQTSGLVQETFDGEQPCLAWGAFVWKSGKRSVPNVKMLCPLIWADMSYPAVPAAATLSALVPPLPRRWRRWWVPGIRRTLEVRGQDAAAVDSASKQAGAREAVGKHWKTGLALCMCSLALQLHKEYGLDIAG